MLSRETRLLLRFELAEIFNASRGSNAVRLVVVLTVSGLCLVVSSHGSPPLIQCMGTLWLLAVALTGVLAKLSQPRHLLTRPISRTQAFAGRFLAVTLLGAALLSTVCALSLGMVGHNPFNSRAIVRFEAAEQFEAAGYRLCFEESSSRQASDGWAGSSHFRPWKCPETQARSAYDRWLRTGASEPHQHAQVLGVWSPVLVATVFAFCFYLMTVSTLLAAIAERPPGGGSAWSQWRGAYHHMRTTGWGTPCIFLITVVFYFAIYELPFLEHALYLHPWLSIVTFAVAASLCVTVARGRWRKASL